MQGELSTIIDSESGLHLVLRTALDYKPNLAAASVINSEPAVAQGPYRAAQILIKHNGSAVSAHHSVATCQIVLLATYKIDLNRDSVVTSRVVE